LNDFEVVGDYGGMEIPRHWRLKKQRYGLVGEVCLHCDHKIFPPRDVCPNCGDEARAMLNIVAQDQVGEQTELVAVIQMAISE